MNELLCIETDECSRYCDALDQMTGLDPAVECQWPERAQTMGQDGEYSEVAVSVGRGLIRKLQDKATAETDDLQNEASRMREVCGDALCVHFNKWDHIATVTGSGRKMTDAEVEHFGQEATRQRIISETWLSKASGEAITLGQAQHDREMLRKHGILFDPDTINRIDRLVDNVSHGRPTLLVGDKGIAKTQIAKFVGKRFSRGEDVAVFSASGGTMSDDLTATVELTEEGSRYRDSQLVQCMRKGVPIIIDEVNLADQQNMMRLQDILLMEPGDSFVLQENDERIVVQPGFAVIATANEASARYRQREQLDAAFRDRFDVMKVPYPDQDTVHNTQYPVVNVRLALAHAVEDSGLENPHVSAGQAVELARLAHATQRLYALPASATADIAQTTIEEVDSNQPIMSDCITPRKMVDILERVSKGTLYGATVRSELAHCLESLDQSGSHNRGIAEKVHSLIAQTEVA